MDGYRWIGEIMSRKWLGGWQVFRERVGWRRLAEWRFVRSRAGVVPWAMPMHCSAIQV